MENFKMRQLNAYIENDSALKFLIHGAYCSALSCRSRLKHPFGWESPYHLLHMNSCRYSNKKLGLFEFVFCWAPVTFGLLCVDAHGWIDQSGENGWRFCGANLLSSVTAGKLPTGRLCTIEPAQTLRWIKGKRIEALRCLMSCKYGLAVCIASRTIPAPIFLF